jgi:DNA-binding transcriptional MerR regulator
VTSPREVDETEDAAPVRRDGKRDPAFRTIGEVAGDLDLPTHVLRFWESKFPQLKPLKRGGGRRYYRPEDIVLLRRIRQCLYQEGYTIRGVQKLLSGDAAADAGVAAAGQGAAAGSLFPLEPEASEAASGGDAGSGEEAEPAAPARPLPPEVRVVLEDLRQELREIRALLAELAGHQREGG